MFNNNIYFLLKSHVYISEKKKEILLYNTMNGKYIESRNESVIKIVRQLNKVENLYCIELSSLEIQRNEEINKFLLDARGKSIGEFIKKKDLKKRPVILRPMLGIKKNSNLKRFCFNNNQIMDYLRDLSLSINSECQFNCKYCSDGFKQFECCHNDQSNSELPITIIHNILSQIEFSSIRNFNISGGNIFNYSEFDKLLELISKFDFKKEFFVHFKNIPNSLNLNKFQKLNNFNINILVDQTVNDEEIKDLLRKLKNKTNYSFNLILQCEESLKNYSKMLKKLNLRNYFFKPYFNGSNLDFFRKFVFIDKEQILNTKYSLKEIYSKNIYNNFLFGDLSIKNTGEVYTNLYRKNVGNIKKKSIREIIYTELNEGTSWTLTRDKITPCKSCIYDSLCPSISKIELSTISKNRIKVVGCNNYMKFREN